MLNQFKYTFGTGETVKVIDVAMFTVPMTISIKTTDVTGKKIEIDTDGAAEYFEADYDASSTATSKKLTVNAPISSIKITAAAADKITISYQSAP